MRSLFGHPTRDRPITALSLLLIGVFVLALQDALFKDISSQTSYWQFQALRAAGNFTFAVLLALGGGGLYLLIPRRAGAVYFRALLMTFCMFCFFGGAPYLTLTQMAAGLYTYPLFVSILAGPVLGEQVGRWRFGAVVLGFGGTALALSPWEEGFTLVQCLPVLAGFFYALNILTIRRACRWENTLAMVFAVAVAFLVSGILGSVLLSIFPLPVTLQQRAPFVFTGWPTLAMVVLGLAVVTSVLNLIGNICLSRAYQTAESSWLVPLDFSYLLFAAFWGKALFDTLPTTNGVIGMTLIATAGVLTAWRERIRRQMAFKV
ncbi:MAG: DMT family transporter [Acidiferrobacterales bacterium]|nr:DMT family transporter [Acidiferrobacterales bacterium]